MDPAQFWISFFLTGVSETATAAVRQANQIVDLRDTFRSSLTNKPRALALLDHLFINPYITVARAAEILSTSNQTARQVVQFLEQQEILQEITGKKWGRLYLADSILEAIEGRSKRTVSDADPLEGFYS